MAYQEEEPLAKIMYETDRKTVADISKQLAVPKQTIYRWIKDGKWQQSVINNALNKVERLQNLRDLVNRLFDEIAASNNPDKDRLSTLRGYMDLLDQYEKSVDIRGTILMATKEIIKCLREEREDLVASFIPFLQNDFPKWIKKQYPESR
jgi:predicted DNA-binding protein YlxM (UPF0122 family)